MERGTIYTLGYSAQDAAAQLERYMREAHTLLVDVRLRPVSRYGERYHWHRRLGNLHYKSRRLHQGTRTRLQNWRP